MRHSIWKATQFVHGTPRLAASHLTYYRHIVSTVSDRTMRSGRCRIGASDDAPCVARTFRAWQVYKRNKIRVSFGAIQKSQWPKKAFPSSLVMPRLNRSKPLDCGPRVENYRYLSIHCHSRTLTKHQVEKKTYLTCSRCSLPTFEFSPVSKTKIALIEMTRVLH